MPVPLRSIPDHEILSRTQALASQERKITLSLLLHLNEIERRQLYLKQGYSSMFVYCTAHLRFSEPAAARRIRTARCLARIPELHTFLESGDVNLTTVSMVSKYLKGSNAADILARIRGRSRREVERVVAELEPRAVLPPDRVRAMVVPMTPPPQAAAPQFTVAGDSEKLPTEAAPFPGHQSVVAPSRPAAAPAMERRALVQFTAHEDVMAKLNCVRSLAAHRLRGNDSMEQVIAFLAEYFIRREDPRFRHERRMTRSGRTSERAAAVGSSRAIPVRVKDEVFVQSGHQCTYVSPGGRRCEAAHALQVDHIVPVALGGVSTIDNLRLLCAKHNRFEAERLLGRSVSCQ